MTTDTPYAAGAVLPDAVLDTVLADPALLLRADRAALREQLSSLPRADAAAEDGRAVFRQAEAIFGGAPVVRAEFASWLHFAAVVLGRGGYAERIAAAEPGMPWRTEWAWWRPVGRYTAHPNLSGDSGAAAYVHEGRELVEVSGMWCPDRWFDLATGASVAAPPAGTVRRLRPDADAGELPYLFGTEDGDPALAVPPTWEEPEPLDAAGRYLLQEARGVAVVRADAAVLEGWPTGGASYASAEGGSPGGPDSPEEDGPLTADRMDDTFGPDGVRRIPEEELPAALEHGPTRTFLREVGLPAWWAGGVSSFTVAEGLHPLPDDPELLVLGAFELAYGETGTVCVHRASGGILLRHTEDGATPPPFPFSRDVETFTVFLESLRRYMGASWDPYPDEAGAEYDYESRMAELDPRALDEEAPSREIWGHLFATITELGVYGY
ncbi:SUKH-4 family immunity protein [Streptomyces catenulae]|uniref:SUKH-4 family immunity protein n=1 Tax=Streptomyces catenulae TaxID=66875 RepID=A0ABV2YT83_9ACTN|nr:SUKH-4 family immunity protein [Streptomyces catenulae]